jgi:uncharacterized protein YfaS (alpha-2-macroglobulin family)
MLSFVTLFNLFHYDIASGFEPTNQTVNNNETATTAGNLTVDTDKTVYVAGETVTVDGKVDKVIEGEMVRLDFYDPDGKPVVNLYGQFAEPNKNGFFSLSPYIPTNAKPGEYTFLATYNKQSVETKIMVK